MSRMAMVVSFLMAVTAGDATHADDAKQKNEALRNYYSKIAGKYEFYHDAAKQQPLELAEKPIMTWSNDDDWSGDVFVWARGERPEVVGCILSGPANGGSRLVFNEFHLLADEPVAAATAMQGQFRWAPKEGLKVRPLEGALAPAATAALRLSQMRTLLRDFTAHMEAEGIWELRLLPQPLLRYQPKEGPVVDGALFTFVWTKGTDPELILLVECRKTKDGLEWFYAPVRFSNRELWLKHRGAEIWRGPFHREPEAESTAIYTTRYLTTVSDTELSP